MRVAQAFTGICAILLCVCAAPSTTKPQSANVTLPTPLILEKDEGERRVVRGWPGHPEPGETFILKVDPKNGGSSHLVLMTAELAPGGEIVAHKHPGADEMLLLETGTAQVHLGASVRVMHAGATVFIPAGTWISLSNIGKDKISMAAIFSSPGFEEYMRAGSVREGEKNVPLSKAEDDEMQKQHAHDVIYQ